MSGLFGEIAKLEAWLKANGQDSKVFLSAFLGTLWPAAIAGDIATGSFKNPIIVLTTFYFINSNYGMVPAYLTGAGMVGYGTYTDLNSIKL